METLNPFFKKSNQISTFSVERKEICTHITALKVVQNTLFIAEGNQVLVCNLTEKKLYGNYTVFRSSSIHGIRTDGNCKILFFGSKSFRIFTFTSTSANKCLISFSSELVVRDWIHDIQWMFTKEMTETLGIISAHNSLTLWNVKEEKISKQFQCKENCILYAASIISCYEDVFIVAVGTVFKQILLWSPNTTNDLNGTKIPLHCLEGHQGVIFSITFNKSNRLICSTSDDRSLRLWKVSCDSIVPEFTLEFWEKSTIYTVHVLFAHESRVWMSSILENCVVSIGEDSYICFWNLNGTLLKRQKCHKNGSIWCLETGLLFNNTSNSEADVCCTAITGGSDGGVYCWEIKDLSLDGCISEISLHSSSEKDFPRVVSLLCSKRVENFITTTDEGWLLLYDMKLLTWTDVHYDKTFSSYCIPAVSFQSTYIALGNIFGDLVLISTEYLSRKSVNKKIKVHEGKICSLYWMDKTNEHLFTCGLNGHMILWKTNLMKDELQLQCIGHFQLPKCKPHWWSTAALYVKSSNCVIVGDRGGSINMFSFVINSDCSHQMIDPCTTHRCIHGENGVTDIEEHNALIYSTGRDGRVLLYYIKDNSLNFLHSIKIPHNLEWIGKMLFYGSDLLLLGFHTKYFIVWSTQIESAVMTVECGGGHRSWDFCLTDDGQATFLAIKKKNMIFYKENLQNILKKSILKVGISGQEYCRICYLFSTMYGSNESMSIVAAGGEDNSLRILGFLDGFQKLSQILPLHSLSGHLSSIRSLAKTKMHEENSYLLVSVGGRAQMKIWKIKNDSYIKCEDLASYILSSGNKQSRKPWKENANAHIDPQTRLMDVSVCPFDTSVYCNEKYIIAIACSDGCFRVYSFDAIARQLLQCYNLEHSANCILKLSSIEIKQTYGRNILFIIGSTDGKLKIINHKNCSAGLVYNYASKDTFPKTEHYDVHHFQLQLHQSGVNALDVKHVSGDMWLICSGGDDNALSAVLVNFNVSSENRINIEIISKVQVLSAHASQITGIKILSHEIIASTSVDQRLNIWKWYLKENSLAIEQIASKISLIPDIAHLECWHRNSMNWTAVVCGQGIESFSLRSR